MRPDIDDLVVAFAVREETLAMLILNGLHLSLGGLQDGCLAVRHDHVVNTDGYTGLCRHTESGVHQLITKDDRILEAHATIGLIDRAGNCAFTHRLVNERERQTFR